MCTFFSEHYSECPEYIWGIGLLAGFKFSIIVRRDPCMICPDIDCNVRGGNYSDTYREINERPKELPEWYWKQLEDNSRAYDPHNYFVQLRKTGPTVIEKEAFS